MPQTTLEYRAEKRATHGTARWALAGWLCPLLPLVTLYAEWGAAWLVLGHRPASSWNDPKGLSAVGDVLHSVNALLLSTMPVYAVIVGIVGMKRGRGNCR